MHDQIMHEGNYLEEAQMLKEQYKEFEPELKRLREENQILKKSSEEQIGVSIGDLDYQTMQMRMMRRYLKSFKDDFIAYNAFLSTILEDVEGENYENLNVLIETLQRKMGENEFMLKRNLKENFSINTCCHGPAPDTHHINHNSSVAYRQKFKSYKERTEKRRKMKQEEFARRRQEIADST